MTICFLVRLRIRKKMKDDKMTVENLWNLQKKSNMIRNGLRIGLSIVRNVKNGRDFAHLMKRA
jgi:hypothetical protein